MIAQNEINVQGELANKADDCTISCEWMEKTPEKFM